MYVYTYTYISFISSILLSFYANLGRSRAEVMDEVCTISTTMENRVHWKSHGRHILHKLTLTSDRVNLADYASLESDHRDNYGP